MNPKHDKRHEHDNEDVDESSDESFPASDPPAYSGGTATPSEPADSHRDRDDEDQRRGD